MTHPSDPGQAPRPPASGPPGQPGQGTGPYGPPPQQPGPVPGPRPSGPGYGTGPYPQPQAQPPQGWQPPPRDPKQKGLLGALFDTNFDTLVTPKLIKVFYVLSLLLISLSALVVVLIGIWVAQLRNGWLLGIIIICASPVIWFFEAMLARIFMEAMVVRFKEVEYLRVIKDKD